MGRYNHNYNYRLRLKAQSDSAKASSLARIVELRHLEEQRHLAAALAESGRDSQMQSTLAAYLLAGSTTPTLVNGPNSHE